MSPYNDITGLMYASGKSNCALIFERKAHKETNDRYYWQDAKDIYNFLRANVPVRTLGFLRTMLTTDNELQD